MNSAAGNDASVKVTIQACPELQSWTPVASRVGGGSWTGVAPTATIPIGSNTNYLFTTPYAVQSYARLFLRFIVEELP